MACGIAGEEGTPQPPRTTIATVTAISYYRWDNRRAGQMRVWMPETVREIDDDSRDE